MRSGDVAPSMDDLIIITLIIITIFLMHFSFISHTVPISFTFAISSFSINS